MLIYIVLLAELLVIAIVILGLYKLKSKITLAPLYIFIGSNQYSQHFLATTLYFKIFDEYSISSGSVVFFTSSLFAILLIYIKEGIPQTRTLIIGIVLSNTTLTILGGITAFQIEILKPFKQSVQIPIDFFSINYRVFLVGTGTLILDSLLVVIIYQFLVKKAKILKMFGGILASLLVVLYFDSVVFSFGSFYGRPGLMNTMTGQIIGKTVSGIIFGSILYLFLRFADGSKKDVVYGFSSQFYDVFSILTYREKFKGLEVKPTELESQLSAQLLRTLDVMSDGFISFDKNWRITYINEVIGNIVGKERAKSLVGRNVWAEFPDVVGDLFYENCYLAFATGAQVTFEYYNNQFERWFDIRAIPSPTGLSIFVIDITESKNSATEIENARTRNAALLNALPDILFTINRDGVLLDFHNPYKHETLVPLRENVGNLISDLVPPDLAKETMKNIIRTLGSGELVEHFYELEYPDGVRNYEARYAKNNDTDVLIIVRDVTTETRTEKALAQSEAKYRSLVEQASDGILVHDMSGKIIEMNEAALNYVGFSMQEISGKTIIDFLFAEDLEDLPIPFEQLKRGETTGTRRRIRKKDDSAIWMDISSRMNDEGNVIAIARDVTDRLAIEREIIESENRFRTLTESAPIGIFKTDLNGKCVYVNEQWLKIAGMTYEQAMGDGWVQGIHPDDRRRIFDEWPSSPEKDFDLSNSFRWKTKDGKVTETDVRAVTVFNHNGEKLGFIGTVSDVTQQKQAASELKVYRDQLEQLVEERTAELEIEKIKAQSADKLKSAFLATMSHELRTPLNSIIGFTGLLLNELAGPVNDEQKKQLGMVKNSGRHLLSLINDILDLSKIEAGELSFSLHSYDFGDSVEKIVTLLEPSAEAKGLDLTFELSPKDIWFVSDERRIEQVLINLVDNAVKFTEVGTVSLNCILDDNILKIAVTDTGIGIKEKDIGKLFVPFSQIDSGLTRNHQGTGLGLSISQKLVKMLGGTIEVESNFGSGSTFTVRFPLNGVKNSKGIPN